MIMLVANSVGRPSCIFTLAFMPHIISNGIQGWSVSKTEWPCILILNSFRPSILYSSITIPIVQVIKYNKCNLSTNEVMMSVLLYHNWQFMGWVLCILVQCVDHCDSIDQFIDIWSHCPCVYTDVDRMKCSTSPSSGIVYIVQQWTFQ